MSLKFYGESNTFFELLNKRFHQNISEAKLGNVYRYECPYEDKLYKMDLFKNGTVQIQPTPPENLYTLVKDTLSEVHNIEVVKSKSNNEIFILHGHDEISVSIP